MPAIITFIGKKNSGKTTLTSKVVTHLNTMGYKVAVIKSSSHQGALFDSPGTDTATHKAAGAESVMFVGPDQMVLQTGTTELSLTTLAHRYFPGVDVVIGEGFKQARKIPKIEVIRDQDHLLRNQVNGVIAVASNIEDTAGNYVFQLDEAQEIAQFIEKRFNLGQPKGIERCALLVNGNMIPLKGFVQDCLGETVEGFISSLKLTDDIQEIELRIKKK
ncbi:MAG: molybdopterin-guanine dinucleotide biosynthesis protein B [Desulfobulbaceae bacterium]|nr:MAG: molybdopterin-guanine dinucleotide biosynthesis protein B [Desulfobulbaceae bacterium]